MLRGYRLIAPYRQLCDTPIQNYGYTPLHREQNFQRSGQQLVNRQNTWQDAAPPGLASGCRGRKELGDGKDA